MAKRGKGKNNQFAIYRSENRKTANKMAKIARHIKKHPMDLQTIIESK